MIEKNYLPITNYDNPDSKLNTVKLADLNLKKLDQFSLQLTLGEALDLMEKNHMTSLPIV